MNESNFKVSEKPRRSIRHMHAIIDLLTNNMIPSFEISYTTSEGKKRVMHVDDNTAHSVARAVLTIMKRNSISHDNAALRAITL